MHVTGGSLCDLQEFIVSTPNSAFYAIPHPHVNPLPEDIALGKEPLRVIGAMAGG